MPAKTSGTPGSAGSTAPAMPATINTPESIKYSVCCMPKVSLASALEFFGVDRERVAILRLEQVVEYFCRHFHLLLATAARRQPGLRKDQGQADRLAVDAVDQEHTEIGGVRLGAMLDAGLHALEQRRQGLVVSGALPQGGLVATFQLAPAFAAQCL